MPYEQMMAWLDQLAMAAMENDKCNHVDDYEHCEYAAAELQELADFYQWEVEHV